MPSLSDTLTASSSDPITPATSLDTNGGISKAAKTPDSNAEAPKDVKKERDRAKMPPPPLPITNGHAPAPMARMPSLSEISSHLHIPSPHTSTTPETPPRPTRTDSSGAQPPSATYAASPSGRLKLPVSAMTRKRSGSVSKTPTLGSLAAIPRPALERRGSNESHPSDDGVKNGSVDGGKSANSTKDAGSTQSATDGKYPSKEYIQGYKDVPSLSAIRHRISLSQSSNGGKNGDPKTDDEVGDVESVETLLEDAKSADSPTTSTSTAPTPLGDGTGKGKQHPLAHSWTLYYDAKGYMPSIEQSAGRDGGTGRGEYEKSLLRVGKIDTVEGFARHMNNLRVPSQIKANGNYHLFKGEIRPMWEDPANHDGGKWVLLFRHSAHLLDIAWENLIMALIGNILDPDDKICGIVASNRPRANRLQIWTRGKDDVESLNELGKRCLEMMGIEPGEMEQVSLEYQYNAANTHPPANTFLHIPFATRSFTPSTPSRLGATSSPSFGHPSPGGSGSHLSPALSSANPSPNPNHSGPLNTRSNNLSINVIHYISSSPLSPNTRAENRPISPAMQITPTPSPKMQYSLPRAPDTATIKASLTSSTSLGPNGGTSMRRLGSGQGTNAFSGPMPGGARSPRAGEAKLAPPTAVPVQGA